MSDIPENQRDSEQRETATRYLIIGALLALIIAGTVLYASGVIPAVSDFKAGTEDQDSSDKRVVMDVKTDEESVMQESKDEEDTTESTQRSSSSEGYQFVEVSAEASCMSYELRGPVGDMAQLTPELDQYLQCAHYRIPFFSEDQSHFFFLGSKGAVDDVGNWVSSEPYTTVLKSYEMETAITKDLITFYPDNEDVRMWGWSPNKEKLMLVVINESRPEEYPTGTKLFIVSIANGEVTQKDKYDIDLDLDCSSNEGCFPMEGLQWKDEQTIQYHDYRCEEEPCTNEDSYQVKYLSLQ